MSRSFRLSFCLLAALALPLPAASQELTEEWGYDRKGDDYDSFRARDLAACKESCRRDRRCQAYTLTREGICYLKDRINSKKQANGAVTGYRPQPGDEGYDDGPRPGGDHDHGGGYGRPSDLTEEWGFDRKGDDFDTFRARNLRDCKRVCSREDRCRAYTYDTRSEICYLKSRINSKKYNSRMVTGYKEDDDSHGDGGYGDGDERVTEERGYDRRGADYRRFDAYSVERCKRACAEDDRCRAYTFDRRDDRCYLKDEVREAERNRDMVTGRKVDSYDDEDGY